MQIIINGNAFELIEKSRSEIKSFHTGNTLQELRAQLVLPDETTSDYFLSMIKEHRDDGIEVNFKDHNILFNIKSESYSFDQSRSSRVFQLLLTELEELIIKAIRLDSIELVPYEYKEEFQNGALHIKMKVKIEQNVFDDIVKLHEKRGYFDVIRHGINLEPVQMRFGRPLWSRHDDIVKMKIILVDKRDDENRTPFGLFEPEMSNMKSGISFSSEVIKELLELLVSKEILSDNEVEIIRTSAKGRLWSRGYNFYQCEDVDL